MARHNPWPTWCVDELWYYETYPDITLSVYSASAHYSLYGCYEKRNPNPFFDYQWYQQYLPYPHVDAMEHYLTLGHLDQHAPCEHFFDMIQTWVDTHAPLSVKLLHHLDFSRPDVQRSSPLRRVIMSEYYPQIRAFAKTYQPDHSLASNHTLRGVESNVVELCDADYTHVRGAVVYLLPVHAKYASHFELWLATLERYRRGIDTFDLVIILKNDNVNMAYDAVVHMAHITFPQLQTLRARYVVHANVGMDIGSWIQFAREHHTEYEVAFFMGTYSVIHAHDWLLKCVHAMYGPDELVLCGTSGGCSDSTGIRPHLPNVHVRTGAFMCQLQHMNAFDFGTIISKKDCYDFEHGPHSLTRAMATLGRVGVVGADGASYAPRQWIVSRTYPFHQPYNCLVSDNMIHVFCRMVRIDNHSPPFQLYYPHFPDTMEWYDMHW